MLGGVERDDELACQLFERALLQYKNNMTIIYLPQ
jgi:hypothetical protein